MSDHRVGSEVIGQSSWIVRIVRASLTFLLVAILPNSIVTSDFECGINRFNNESPLTERIVGGNNSLQ